MAAQHLFLIYFLTAQEVILYYNNGLKPVVIILTEATPLCSELRIVINTLE